MRTHGAYSLGAGLLSRDPDCARGAKRRSASAKAASSKMSEEAKGFSKWQIALAVGSGAAAVVGICLLTYAALRSRNEPQSQSRTPEETDQPSPAEVPGEATSTGEDRRTSTPEVNIIVKLSISPGSPVPPYN